jgi:flagellar hook assembly protein FlgD
LISSSATSVTSGTLATWTTNDLGNNIPVQNGSLSLRLTVADKAGNSATVSVPVTVDNIYLSSVSSSTHLLDTSLNQAATISFTVNKATTVTLKIVPEKSGVNGAPMYQTSLNCADSGSYSFTWNDRNNAGVIVPDEAYLYILEATDGTRTDSYAPTAPAPRGSFACEQSSTGYFPYRNIPLVINYTVTQPERVNINIHWGPQDFKIMDGVPHVPGSYTWTWDGRDPSNKVLDGGGVAYCSSPYSLAENHIITTGNIPKVTSVKADPYQLDLSYGQSAKVKYSISAQALVTVKIIAPTNAETVLVNSQPQAAGDYDVNWTTTDSGDTTGKKFIANTEGDYTIQVSAVNPANGASSVAKGNIRVGY